MWRCADALCTHHNPTNTQQIQGLLIFFLSISTFVYFTLFKIIFITSMKFRCQLYCMFVYFPSLSHHYFYLDLSSANRRHACCSACSSWRQTCGEAENMQDEHLKVKSLRERNHTKPTKHHTQTCLPCSLPHCAPSETQRQAEMISMNISFNTRQWINNRTH